MIQDEFNEKHYIADEGKIFIRKIDKEKIGWNIYLGDNDKIKNYTEIKMSEDDIKLMKEIIY